VKRVAAAALPACQHEKAYKSSEKACGGVTGGALAMAAASISAWRGYQWRNGNGGGGGGIIKHHKYQ